MIHRNWGLEQVKRHCTCGCGYPTVGEGSSNGRMHSSISIYIKIEDMIRGRYRD